MWALRNTTRFNADRGFVRDLRGAEVWVVAVKGTFDLHPTGSTSVAAEQLPVSRAPRYAGDPARSSMIEDSDLLLEKSATDVVLHASAHAPRGKPARSVVASIQIAGREKMLRVTGRRYWAKVLGSMVLSDPHPFQVLPISYEAASGGSDPKTGRPLDMHNPAGTGAEREPAEGALAPSIVRPSRRRRRTKESEPAGFGPIAPHWAGRARYAGTYDKTWHHTRRPLLPHDFDSRFYQCAPEDQQFAGFLRGGEDVVLHNLTPGGTYAFRLPFVALAFSTRLGWRSVEHRGHLHTVCIEPDAQRLTMVWHTSLPCHGQVEKLERTLIQEKRVVGARR